MVKPTQFKLKLNLRIARLKAFTDPPPRSITTLRGVGFTGSRSDYQNKVQTRVLENLLSNLCCRAQCFEDMQLSHGDCVGWDEVCHKIASKLHLRITIHPPTNPSQRAFCRNAYKTTKSKPYLERNRDIVDTRRYLVAVSSTMKEEWRSGTWSTVRYARKQNKPIFIILPDGALISEGV